jgi:hypothetical protein
VFVGLIDTIRTRVLRLALELKDDLGAVSDNVRELPKEKIDQSIVTNIFGGINVIASRDFTQINRIEVGQGDWAALAKALHALGIDGHQITGLQSAITEDSSGKDKPSVGQRTTAWIKNLGSKLGQAGIALGVEIAKTEVTKWVHQYLGLPPT